MMVKAVRKALDFITDMVSFKYDETKSSLSRGYRRLPSLSDRLQWQDYDPETKAFLMADGKSHAAIYEVTPLPTEARSEDYLASLRDKFSGLIFDTFEHYMPNESPWIVQFYLSDERSLNPFYKKFLSYGTPVAKKSAFRKVYESVVKSHLELVTKSGGLFNDPRTGQEFQGRVRRIRLVIYRVMTQKARLRKGWTALKDLEKTCKKLEMNLARDGIDFERYDDYQFFLWMGRWFNPKPPGFETTDAWLNAVQFPRVVEDRTYGYDLSQIVFSELPKTDKVDGLYYFNNMPYKYVPLLGMQRKPELGHLTAEKTVGSDPRNAKYYALFDKFPEDSVFVMTLVIESKDYRLNEIEKQEKRANKVKDAKFTREECKIAKDMVAQGNHLFPVTMGVYIKSRHRDELESHEDHVNAQLAGNGFHVLMPQDDLVKLESFTRFLPMNYDYQFDNKWLERSRLLSLKQIGALMPLFGRSRGSGNPLQTFFNRVGEILSVDSFSNDSKINSHLFLLGATGGGKSALLVYLIMQALALYFPHITIIDAGGSFELLADFLEKMGLQINKFEIRDTDYPHFSLNPFILVHELMEQVDRIERLKKHVVEEIEKTYDEELKHVKHTATMEEKKGEQKTNRNYASEFITAAIIMVTGGDLKEEQALTRQDRQMLLEAIIACARSVVQEKRDQMLPSDLMKKLYQRSEDYANTHDRVKQDKSIRLARMADGMNAFLSMPLNAMYFDCPGKPLMEVDVTWFELGLWKDDQKENEAPRALAFISLMNRTMHAAENKKDRSRFHLLVGDECHVVTTKPATAASLVQAAKMGRKVGLWLWLATQNTRDFPDDARKALSMFEFMIITGMISPTELDQIDQIINFSEEQRTQVESQRNEKGKYAEASLFSNQYALLFRNIPPRLCIALAMTNPDEKNERTALMQTHNCSQLEAALLKAMQMEGRKPELAIVRRFLNQIATKECVAW